MTSSKELFCSQKQLCEWWGTVVANPMFDQVMLHARGTALEQEPSAEQRVGAIHFSQILSTLHQPVGISDHFPRPGLNHSFDEQTKAQPKTKPQKK
jgi:hypothetical protein